MSDIVKVVERLPSHLRDFADQLIASRSMRDSAIIAGIAWVQGKTTSLTGLTAGEEDIFKTALNNCGLAISK